MHYSIDMVLIACRFGPMPASQRQQKRVYYALSKIARANLIFFCNFSGFLLTNFSETQENRFRPSAGRAASSLAGQTAQRSKARAAGLSLLFYFFFESFARRAEYVSVFCRREGEASYYFTQVTASCVFRHAQLDKLPRAAAAAGPHRSGFSVFVRRTVENLQFPAFLTG